MRSHGFEICRGVYKTMRHQHKAPAVALVKLWPGMYAGETTDGKIINESLSNHCCKWAAKVEVLVEWVEKFSIITELNKGK